ncbi:MAG: DUF4190 domain-containing protein [Armatimonadota bacterium]|nr:DUF4190 domain-containing protein [Armatimonadota bacterium]
MEQPYGPAMKPGYNLALASLIVGAVGLLLSCCIPGLPLIAGIVAIVLGVMGQSTDKRAGTEDSSTKTMAIIGIVLGAIGLMLGLVGIIYYVVFARHFMHGMPGQPPFPAPRMPMPIPPR